MTTNLPTIPFGLTPYHPSTSPEGWYRPLTKDIPIARSSLFRGDLGKAVTKQSPRHAITSHWGTVLSCRASLCPSPLEARSERQVHRHHFVGKTGPGMHRATPPNPTGSGRRSGPKGLEHQPPGRQAQQPQWQQTKQGSKPNPCGNKGKKGSNA